MVPPLGDTGTTAVASAGAPRSPVQESVSVSMSKSGTSDLGEKMHNDHGYAHHPAGTKSNDSSPDAATAVAAAAAAVTTKSDESQDDGSSSSSDGSSVDSSELEDAIDSSAAVAGDSVANGEITNPHPKKDVEHYGDGKPSAASIDAQLGAIDYENDHHDDHSRLTAFSLPSFNHKEVNESEREEKKGNEDFVFVSDKFSCCSSTPGGSNVEQVERPKSSSTKAVGPNKPSQATTTTTQPPMQSNTAAAAGGAASLPAQAGTSEKDIEFQNSTLAAAQKENTPAASVRNRDPAPIRDKGPGGSTPLMTRQTKQQKSGENSPNRIEIESSTRPKRSNAPTTTGSPSPKRAKTNQESSTKRGQEKKAAGDDDSDGPYTYVIQPKATFLPMGERVYAKFPPDGQYYWGIITNVATRKNKIQYYEVFFDDKDRASNLLRQSIYSIDDLKVSGPKPPELPEHQALIQEKLRKNERLDIADLSRIACGDCENCDRNLCGSCASCLFRHSTGTPTCCFQKMCCRIPEALKAQVPKKKGLLPDGYSFIFREHQSNPEYNGLSLISEGGRFFSKLEALMGKDKASPQQAFDFYKYVGLEAAAPKHAAAAPPPNKDSSAVKDNSAVKGSDNKSYSPAELLTKRCGQCKNCAKSDCLNCASCVRNSKRPQEKECCLQKMCLNIPLEKKVQPALGFPPGWFFVFETPPNSELKDYQGLILWSPASRKYYSVEGAKSHSKVALANLDPEVFYTYVGLGKRSNRPTDDATAVQQTQPRVVELGAINSIQNTAPSKSLSLEDLYRGRCTDCPMCAKPSCGKCQACVENKTRAPSRRQVCLKKMCSTNFSESCKAQEAKGLPKGWRFYFDHPKKTTTANKEDGDKLGLVLVSPPGGRFQFKYRSLEAAAAKLQGSLGTSQEIAEMKRVFYKYIGCGSTAVAKTQSCVSNDLIGRIFCQRWTALDGKTKILYGTIESCRDDGEDRHFTVHCSKESRALLNASESRIAGLVPEREEFTESLVLGGCLQVDAGAKNVGVHDIPIQWITPDMRHEDFEVAQDGSRSPRLTLHVRGFELIFRAKQSTKPNAGKGVFLGCKSLTGAPFLELRPGELIDMGIYAPFRREDRKHHCIFALKNLIHSLKCEEWSFGLRSKDDDFIFDITDDRTGDIHEIARRHMPAYVNETDPDAGDIPTVTAEHDPEGSVHYLVGHRLEDDGPFRLVADGSETEILVDYGPRYETVRLRKNYSRLPPHEAAAKMLELQGEVAEYFEALLDYNTKQISESLRFIHKICKPQEPLDKTVAERALLAALVLQSRAKSLLTDSFFDSDNSGDDGGYSTVTTEGVVETAAKLVKYLYGFWWNSPAGLQQSLLSVKAYELVLKKVFGDFNFRQMTPAEFSARFILPEEDD